MKSTIIYNRVSTEEQNPDNQIKDCMIVVERLGILDFEILQEKKSGFKDVNREVFESIRKEIIKDHVKHLIVWDWDRLFRNRKKLMEFFKLCELYNCKIHSFRQKYFEDFYKIPKPFDEIVSNLVLNLMGHMAEDESKKKSGRVKSAVRRQEGKVTKSYKGNRWGRKPLAKKTIEEVIRLYNQGESIRKISKLVFYWDKNNNKTNISTGCVHKIIQENKAKNN